MKRRCFIVFHFTLLMSTLVAPSGECLRGEGLVCIRWLLTAGLVVR